jgi:hypothetical protein
MSKTEAIAAIDAGFAVEIEACWVEYDGTGKKGDLADNIQSALYAREEILLRIAEASREDYSGFVESYMEDKN